MTIASLPFLNNNNNNQNSNTNGNAKKNQENDDNHQNSSLPASSLNLFQVLVGNCYYSCEPGMSTTFDPPWRSSQRNNNNNNSHNHTTTTTIQFVELHGIQFIGLGCMADELTPRERVYDTLEQLTDRNERLLSIGYVVVHNNNNNNNNNTTNTTTNTATTATTQTIPLDVWNQNYPNDLQNLDRPVQTLVQQILNKDYRNAQISQSFQLAQLKKNWNQGNNPYLAGITAHNLAVIQLLARHQEEQQQQQQQQQQHIGSNHGSRSQDSDDEAARRAQDEDIILELFREAIQLKELAFGKDHLEVAYSWDELGIQYYAHEQFEDALQAFSQAQKVRLAAAAKTHHPATTSTTPVPLSSASWAIASVPSQEEGSQVTNTTTTTSQSQPPKQQQKQRHIPLTGGGVAMVLNNIACCKFQLKQFSSALQTLEEARAMQQMNHYSQQQPPPPSTTAPGSGTRITLPPTAHKTATTTTTSSQQQQPQPLADLDLLYHAIVLCNCGYLHLCLKLYDEARSLLEEALLIQQSVLEESHRAIRDTRSNLELTNAFHL